MSRPLEKLDILLSEKKVVSALKVCNSEKLYFTGYLLGKIHNRDSPEYYGIMESLSLGLNGKDTTITPASLASPAITTTPASSTNTSTKKKKVLLLCNWATPKGIADQWNRMTKGNYTWNDIEIIWTGQPDYHVILNTPGYTMAPYDPAKTLIFHMEPNMSDAKLWNRWSNPKGFMKVFTHETDYANFDWHISKNYNELCENLDSSLKTEILSTVLSKKYTDPGHMRRIDFVKFLEKNNVKIDVYGNNFWNYKNYKGSLPIYEKDNALIPYKYTFNAENTFKKNYFTEKLIDGILCECLVFYCGCYNIRDFIDEKAYVYLSLENFQKDMETIEKAIKEDWYSQRLPYIRKAKQKILNELQFFPRLERILNAQN